MLKCDKDQETGTFSQFVEDKINSTASSYVSTRPIWSVCMCFYCQLRKRVTLKGLKSHRCSFSDMGHQIAMTLSASFVVHLFILLFFVL